MKSGTSPKLAADHIEKASFFEAPIYFFKPARDRNDWAKGERDERTASHPE